MVPNTIFCQISKSDALIDPLTRPRRNTTHVFHLVIERGKKKNVQLKIFVYLRIGLRIVFCKPFVSKRRVPNRKHPSLPLISFTPLVFDERD